MRHSASRRGVLGIVVAATVTAGLATPAVADPDPLPHGRVATSASRPVKVGHMKVPLDPRRPGGATIRVGWELYPATGTSRGTVLAIEGGPGYATTDSRDYYLDLVAPLRRHRDLLLVDARGTGTSSVIRCADLQANRGPYLRAVARCGRQLGRRSDRYGSAFAADDMARVLDRLGIDRVDVYGDSYGTFLGQAFAVRHPDRVRTLTLDAAYPVEGLNPWYPDLNRALRQAVRSVCRRDRECAGDPVDRFARAADRLRRQPLTGRAYDADGTRRTVRLDPGGLAYLLGTATYGTTVYEEIDAAVRSWMTRDVAAPLLRIAAEQGGWGGNGPATGWSAGAYAAVTCHDYPQLWSRQDGRAEREESYRSAVARLRRDRPHVFAPFTINDWLSSDWAEFDSCLRWPRPQHYRPAVPRPTHYPRVPTLVLVGDLDSITSAEGARTVARHFPRSTFVKVANQGHVTALSDPIGCASGIVRRFIRTAEVTRTGCARTAYPTVRTTDAFPRYLRAVHPVRGRAPLRARRAVAAAVATVGDVGPRWYAMYGSRGRGLRGGSFTTTGLVTVRFVLRDLELVEGLRVSGRVRWDRRTGESRATVHLAGLARGHLRVTWQDSSAWSRVTGRVAGHPVSVRAKHP